MGSLANLPTFLPAPQPYSHTDFNAIFAALTIAAGAVGTNELANAAVTLAKFQNIATASLLGRKTDGTGAPEVLSVADINTLLSLGTMAQQNADAVNIGNGEAVLSVLQANLFKFTVNGGYATSGAIGLNLNVGSMAYIGLTGNATFSASGQAAGIESKLLLKNTTGGAITLTWPAWTVPTGTVIPTNLPAGAVLIIRISCNGGALADVIAAYN